MMDLTPIVHIIELRQRTVEFLYLLLDADLRQQAKEIIAYYDQQINEWYGTKKVKP